MLKPGPELLEGVAEEKARRHLAAFAALVTGGKWQRAPHLDLLCKKLEAVERGEILRLIITIPPRHGKSMLVSEIFTAWCLGRHPDWPFIVTSYAERLARTLSGRAREHFRVWGERLWGYKVSRSSAAKGQWEVASASGAAMGGGYLSGGVGGPITGFGAHGAIVDDPIKNWKEAQSETVRDAVWDWYRSVLRTRLAPYAFVIVCQTRWHDEDLAGRLVAADAEGDSEDAEGWDVINLPAMADDDDMLGRLEGEPLWPERFGETFLRKMRRSLGPTMWLALYQGKPRRREGALLDISKVEVCDTMGGWPKDLRWSRVWDYAHTERQRVSDDPDYTSGTLLAYRKRDDGAGYSLYVRHVWRCRESAPVRDAGIRQVIQSDGPYVRIGVEDSIDSRDGFESMRAAIGSARSMERITLDGDKVVRATPLEAIFAAGDVHILAGEWNMAWFDEVSGFPYAKHDDQVDNLSAGYKMQVTAPIARRVRVG